MCICSYDGLTALGQHWITNMINTIRHVSCDNCKYSIVDSVPTEKENDPPEYWGKLHFWGYGSECLVMNNVCPKCLVAIHDALYARIKGIAETG